MGVVKWIVSFALIGVGIIAAVGHHFFTSALLLFASVVIIFAGPGILQKIPGWASLGTF